MSQEQEPQDTAAMAHALFCVECTFHWSCETEKGHQRIAVSFDTEMPFSPSVGICIGIGDEVPVAKIKQVIWDHARQVFCIYGRSRLKGWDSKLFESLLDEIRDAGSGYDPTLYDDNWIYKE